MNTYSIILFLQWKTTPAPVASVPSFKDIQMADQEEMKKQEKQNQIENERKRAENLKNQESRNQVSIFFEKCKIRF